MSHYSEFHENLDPSARTPHLMIAHSHAGWVLHKALSLGKEGDPPRFITADIPDLLFCAVHVLLAIAEGENEAIDEALESLLRREPGNPHGS